MNALQDPCMQAIIAIMAVLWAIVLVPLALWLLSKAWQPLLGLVCIGWLFIHCV